MKRIILFAVAVACIAGCSVMKPTPRIESAYLMDFRPYSSADFFLSPDPYNGDFEPIGEIRIEISPALMKPVSGSQYEDSVYSQGKSVIPEVVPMKDLLEAIVSKALDLGANGIANLEIMTEQQNIVTSRGLFTVTTMPVTKYIVTGFCIIRK